MEKNRFVTFHSAKITQTSPNTFDVQGGMCEGADDAWVVASIPPTEQFHQGP